MRTVDLEGNRYRIGTITDSNAMFCYFEMIKTIGVRSVLDVGMFLKRIGAVSRQMVGTQVDTDVFLVGIDFFPEVQLPIYSEVYNQMLSLDDFILFLDGTKKMPDLMEKKFDLAVMLEENAFLKESDKIMLAEYFMKCSAGILTDEQTGNWMSKRQMVKGYYPINIENSRYAWIPVEELHI